MEYPGQMEIMGVLATLELMGIKVNLETQEHLDCLEEMELLAKVVFRENKENLDTMVYKVHEGQWDPKVLLDLLEILEIGESQVPLGLQGAVENLDRQVLLAQMLLMVLKVQLVLQATVEPLE